jgi:hypothetical protein
MHGSMHVSGTHSWKKQGGPEGGLSFLRGGHRFVGGGGRFRPSTPLRAGPQPSGGTTFVSSHPASTKCNFPSFSRETWSVTVSALKIGEI